MKRRGLNAVASIGSLVATGTLALRWRGSLVRQEEHHGDRSAAHECQAHTTLKAWQYSWEKPKPKIAGFYPAVWMTFSVTPFNQVSPVLKACPLQLEIVEDIDGGMAALCSFVFASQ